MKTDEMISKLNSDYFDMELAYLYGGSRLSYQKKRYEAAVNRFCELFPCDDDIRLFSAPGRTELGGNHTDHQCGCALAAAVSLDMAAVVSFNDSGKIRLYSEGFGMSEVDVCKTDPDPDEYGTTAALIRGINAGMRERGINTCGFDAYTVSDVPGGSGLSSSAAFETLIGTIISLSAGSPLSPAVIAKIGQYAENRYFGKSCGLLDQAVCASGGLVFLDFRDSAAPVIQSFDFDFEKAGYCVCITDTKGSHSDMTEDYTAVPGEMRLVAEYFGKSVLREVDRQDFLNALPSLHGKMSDRAILRAAHFFDENQRAVLQAQALQDNDVERFIALYKSSARSSSELLQNLYSSAHPDRQGITLGIMLSRMILGEDCPVRVHGGGFAGTVQAIVPTDKAELYAEKMDEFFGSGSCSAVRIRPTGGAELRRSEG